MSKVFIKESSKMPAGAIFLSGSGTNAEKILSQFHEKNIKRHWTPRVLVTDRPKSSRARELALKYNLPLIEHTIASFYKNHGMNRVTLATVEGRKIRDLWTQELKKKLEPYQIDFGILAGFVPLTNIVAELPCLNVHPGDLTYMKNGVRCLVGLHTVPVELAIMENIGFLRSSVILVQPYSADLTKDVDSGHVLGISRPMEVDLKGHSYAELKAIFDNRSGGHLHGTHKDLLFELATWNQERLKYAGDHVVYPEVIDDFAQGKFREDDDGVLLYREAQTGSFVRIRTVEYRADGSRSLIL